MKILNLLNFVLFIIFFVTFIYNTITQFIFVHSQSSDKEIHDTSFFYFISFFLVLNIDFKTKLWLLFPIPLRIIEPDCLTLQANLLYRRAFRISRAILFYSSILLAMNIIIYFKLQNQQ